MGDLRKIIQEEGRPITRICTRCRVFTNQKEVGGVYFCPQCNTLQ